MIIKKSKTFKIITFGCRVNQAESRMMGEKLIKEIPHFAKATRGKEKPDLVIINTCCVTNKAEREVRKEIRRVNRENPDCFLVVCGCWVNKIKNKKLPARNSYAQSVAGGKVKSYSVKLKVTDKNSEILRYIDLLIRNEEKEKIGEILKMRKLLKTRKTRKTHCDLSDLSGLRASAFYKDKYSKSKKALVKIQEGCDNFCAYCIVSYVRGRSKSRPAREIIKEIKSLVERGIEEVVLTGIDISSYNFQFSIFNFQSIFKSQFSKYENDLVRLIKVILEETKIKKISFGSMGLKVFDDQFISFITNHQSLITNHFSSHFHIPLQSGCDAVLKRMKRNYSVSDFVLRISDLKKKIPGFSFSTDIIVGFPGETREEFEETVRVIREIRGILGKRFKKIHVFRYSSKKGTLAEKMEGRKGWEKVDEREKKRRAKIISHL